MSKVPPPRSKTAIFSSFFLSRPYASDAAVGSLMMRRTLSPAMRPASLVACRWLSLKYAGHGDNRLGDLLAEIVLGGLLHLLQDDRRDLRRAVLLAADLDPGVAVVVLDDLVRQHLDRLLHFGVVEPAADQTLDREDRVVGLVIAWRWAICPTSRSPASVNATTDGVVRLPSELAITTGSPPSMIATQELVVPRSIPITFAIFLKVP